MARISQISLNGVVYDIGGSSDGTGDAGEYALKKYYGDDNVSIGRVDGSAVGRYSFAFGYESEATADGAFTEGIRTRAVGSCSHAEGYLTVAGAEDAVEEYGWEAHAEGQSTKATGSNSHAEGYLTEAKSEDCHAEGWGCVAGERESEGYCAHAEGIYSYALGVASHSEGIYGSALGMASHVEGGYWTSVDCSEASGYGSHAEGASCYAYETCSHAQGLCTQAGNYASFSAGKFSRAMNTGGASNTVLGDVFVIGNGTEASALSNAFRVSYRGQVYALAEFNSSGADYAEYIKEWADGNPDGEDRVGYFVTVKDGGLVKAEEGDYIIGITSGNPSVLGNSDEDYYWRYERDDFGRILTEDVEEERLVVETAAAEEAAGTRPAKAEDGRTVLPSRMEHAPKEVHRLEKTGKVIKGARMVQAEAYDATRTYAARADRPEWDAVGMIGVLPVRDDGTCEAGGFAKCGGGGSATRADKRGWDTYFVLERVNESIVKVVLK